MGLPGRLRGTLRAGGAGTGRPGRRRRWRRRAGSGAGSGSRARPGRTAAGPWWGAGGSWPPSGRWPHRGCGRCRPGRRRRRSRAAGGDKTGSPSGNASPSATAPPGRVGARDHEPVQLGRGAGQLGAGDEGEAVAGPDRLPVGGHRQRAGQVRQLGVGPERRGQLGLGDPVGEQDPHGGAVPPVAGREQPHHIRRRELEPLDRGRPPGE